MLRIIGVSEDYGVVVVVEIPAKYWVYNSNNLEKDWERLEARADEGDAKVVFDEVTVKEAREYILGVAEGVGLAILPPEMFSSLQDVWKWVKGRQEDHTLQMAVDFGSAPSPVIETNGETVGAKY